MTRLVAELSGEFLWRCSTYRTRIQELILINITMFALLTIRVHLSINKKSKPEVDVFCRLLGGTGLQAH